MNKCLTISVKSELDVIAARMAVRDLARSIGMNLGDQARISLATSSVAFAMGMGKPYQGQIRAECLQTKERSGVQVTCTQLDGTSDSAPGGWGDARWMVDEMTVAKLPLRHWCITLVKWKE